MQRPHIGAEIYETLAPALDRLTVLQDGFATDRRETGRRLDELVQQEEQVLLRLRDDLAKAQRWKRRLSFMALLGFVLVLGLGIALPRLMAGNAATYAVIGGDWTATTGNAEACVFFAD